MAQTFSQSVIDKAQKEQPWVTKTRKPNVYRVVPRRQWAGRIEHGKYECEVRYDADGIPEVLSCTEYRKKEPCQGFSFTGGGCYHAFALAFRLAQREEKELAA